GLKAKPHMTIAGSSLHKLIHRFVFVGSFFSIRRRLGFGVVLQERLGRQSVTSGNKLIDISNGNRLIGAQLTRLGEEKYAPVKCQLAVQECRQLPLFVAESACPVTS